MRSITHRELRNNSAEVLRAVAAGESILITNNGQVAAIIAPPRRSTLEDLIATGEARGPLAPQSTLADIEPVSSDLSSAEIVADIRGQW